MTYSSKLSVNSGQTPIKYDKEMESFRLAYSHKSTRSETLYSLWDTLLARPSSILHLPSLDLSRLRGPPLIQYHFAQWDSMKFCLGRKFLITKTGSIGLAPPEAKPGDNVAVLVGAPTPHVLRKQGDHYKLIGECYVHGIMGGEALGHLDEDLKAMGHRCRPCPNRKSNARLEKFTIV
jgi:hypothetical protein